VSEAIQNDTSEKAWLQNRRLEIDAKTSAATQMSLHEVERAAKRKCGDDRLLNVETSMTKLVCLA
jgi:hypothetical protein